MIIYFFVESADTLRLAGSESAFPTRKLHSRHSGDFIIHFSGHGGPCFVAQHQHCWEAALSFLPSVSCQRSRLLGSPSATRPETGRSPHRSACVRRRRSKARGCDWRKDKLWTAATLKRSSPLWGSQSKNRLYLWTRSMCSEAMCLGSGNTFSRLSCSRGCYLAKLTGSSHRLLVTLSMR